MHSPERIREALAWLYGVEFRNGEVQYWATDSSVRVWFRASDECWIRDQDGWDEDISAEVAHALEVTAPWEWERRELAGAFEFSKKDVYAAAAGGGWSVSVPGTTMLYEAASLEAAKTAARAAYLTWMRGCLALRGLPNG